MTHPDELLRRIEHDSALATSLAWPGDFDVRRREPVDSLVLPSGTPLQPVAGCGGGGTYFLCGSPLEECRPVLYADSEGQATLMGADLVEALTLVVVLPFWRDLTTGATVSELAAALWDEEPDFARDRDSILRALALSPATEDEVAIHLKAVAARTSPDYVPFVSGENHGPYSLLF